MSLYKESTYDRAGQNDSDLLMICDKCEKEQRYINGLCAECTRLIQPPDASLLDSLAMIKVVFDECFNEVSHEPRL